MQVIEPKEFLRKSMEHGVESINFTHSIAQLLHNEVLYHVRVAQGYAPYFIMDDEEKNISLNMFHGDLEPEEKKYYCEAFKILKLIAH